MLSQLIKQWEVSLVSQVSLVKGFRMGLQQQAWIPSCDTGLESHPYNSPSPLLIGHIGDIQTSHIYDKLLWEVHML